MTSRSHVVAAAFVTAALLAVAGGRPSAQARTAQTAPTPVTYSATAINMDPSVRMTATTVDIVIDRWSTDTERNNLLETLLEGGQKKLLDALQDTPKVGYIKTPDSLAYDLHYAHRVPAADGGERIVLVTDRYISFWEAASSARTLDYPFTIIEMRLDGQGQGEGKIAVATKITANRESGEITLENYAAQPVNLTSIKRQKK